MKFKGTYASGKNKGEVIEYSASEKVNAAIKMAIAEHFDGYRTSVSSITLGPVTSSPNGNLLRGKWANNVYVASGEVTVTKHRLSDGAVIPGKKVEFTLTVKDALDANGLPDLKMEDFKTS